jgi:hypothetical protein
LTTIQLPPLSPSAPVRTQGSSRATLSGGGWLRHTALGWRVRTPWTTPANGGSHGAAPPRNLGVRCGQRPSVHRLQRCRGPSGPRASGATAPPHVCLDTTLATASPGVTGAPREGRSEHTVAGGGRGGTGRRRAKLQQTITSGAGAGPKASLTPEPERRSVLQGRSVEAREVCAHSPLHILTDPAWAAGRGAIVQVRKRCWGGRGLLWGWSVHDSLSHTKWATFLVRPDPFVRTW